MGHTNPVIVSYDREKQRHSAKPNIKTLTAVGRLVKQKGFDLLIAASAAVAISIPTWQLVIRGEGPERHALEKLVKDLAMEERILLPGVSNHPGGWIDGSDAFVLSSRFEGWGNALLEAMASGLPVVSFDCEWGPAEMTADGVNGILVAREDVRGLSLAIATLMNDEELRRKLGAAAALSAANTRMIKYFFSGMRSFPLLCMNRVTIDRNKLFHQMWKIFWSNFFKNPDASTRRMNMKNCKRTIVSSRTFLSQTMALKIEMTM